MQDSRYLSEINPPVAAGVRCASSIDPARTRFTPANDQMIAVFSKQASRCARDGGRHPALEDDAFADRTPFSSDFGELQSDAFVRPRRTRTTSPKRSLHRATPAS